MNPPRLNRRLILEARQQVADGAGGYTETWVPLGQIWADIRAGRGHDADADHIAMAEVPFDIILRAAPFDAPSRPIAGQRFREGSRAFAIKAVAEFDPDGRFLRCVTTEEVAR